MHVLTIHVCIVPTQQQRLMWFYVPHCVLDPPEVTTTLGPIETFNVNSTLTLQCGFMGIPYPSLEWNHNGLLLSDSIDSITITNTSNMSSYTSVLEWMYVPIDAAGIFICVATNNLGSANTSITVQIRSKFLLYDFVFKLHYG